MNEIINSFFLQGAGGVSYVVERVGDAVTRGGLGAPTSTSLTYTIRATGGAGNYPELSKLFFQWVGRNAAADPWGNPLEESGGIELKENADSVGRFWTAALKYSFKKYVSPTSSTDGGGSSPGTDVNNETFSLIPYISGFSTAGGTRRTFVSLGTRAYPITGDAPEFGGGIGWNGETFEGVDVASPSIQFEVTARTPSALVQSFGAYLNKIIPYIGTVNASRFFGCDPGTVLFLGCSSGALKTRKGSDGSAFPYWEMSLNFAASPNVAYQIGGVTIEKGGWEYLWTLGDFDGSLRAVYVERVYQTKEFNALGVGGK